MWARARTDVQERVEQVAEDLGTDPFADLQPMEKPRKPKLVEHRGSIHQIVADVPTVAPDPKPPSENAKYWNRPRLDLVVLRRFVVMVVTLSMFAAASGGVTVAVDFSWLGG